MFGAEHSFRQSQNPSAIIWQFGLWGQCPMFPGGFQCSLIFLFLVPVTVYSLISNLRHPADLSANLYKQMSAYECKKKKEKANKKLKRPIRQPRGLEITFRPILFTLFAPLMCCFQTILLGLQTDYTQKPEGFQYQNLILCLEILHLYADICL